MIIKNAQFVISVASCDKLPQGAKEIAVAGRSNVGKSSFINFLTNNGRLAKTSSTPGHTRLINYFDINNGEFCLVDLPGYGYARVSHGEKEKWGKLIEQYLLQSARLANVFLIVDIRHQPTVLDKQMIIFLTHYNIPFTVIATKSDKINKTQLALRKRELAAELKMAEGNIYEVSALNKTGKERILERIEQVLAVPDSDTEF